MKKYLIALVLGLLLVAALSTIALADNGPHGGFNGSTDACASCHRAHSAVSADGFLLVAGDVYELCTSCHDGTGAFTNVVDGYYDTQVGDPGKAAFAGGWGDANVGLFGGGFEFARMLTDYGNAFNEGGLASATTNVAADQNTSLTSWARFNRYDLNSAAPVARAVTSMHSVDGLGASTGAGTIWGSGNYQASAVSPFGAGSFDGVTTHLECTSCHDPHGNAGRNATNQPVPSYRLLRYTPSGSNGFEVASQVSATGYWDTDVAYAASTGLTGAIVPSAAGAWLRDPAVKWYTINSDFTLDSSVLAMRGRATSNEIFVANFAGQGDYMGRYYAYRRPSGTLTGYTGTGTQLACWDGVSQTLNTSLNTTSCGTTPGAGNGGTAFNNLPAHDAMGFWCATCHDRYLAPGGASRTTDSTDPGYHYRHRAQALSNTGMGTGQYTCADCHNAHGSAATASSTLAANASYAAGSVLLKGDNRAVCIRCHAGAVNFFNITTSPAAPMIVAP